MKNIHVLPTDKPSRLFRSFGKLNIDDYITESISTRVQNQNIYITSDEEIKDPCFIFNNCIETVEYYDLYNIRDTFTQYPSIIKYCKKIILTTDQDLIKDGVQAIDDEFLEWFVKNPSCEEVEVIKCYTRMAEAFYGYEIIIPKEEVKQELEKEMFELEQELDIPLHLRWHNSKPKQETPEEVKLAILFHNTYEKLAPSFGYETREDTKSFDITTPNGKLMIAVCKEIIKWQQERMYSEEDMQSLIKIRNYFGENDKTSFEHFAYSFLDGIIKQFKKK